MDAKRSGGQYARATIENVHGTAGTRTYTVRWVNVRKGITDEKVAEADIKAPVFKVSFTC